MASLLVVDDDPDICSLLQFKLESCGHTVSVEHDGRAALDAIEGEAFDLLLIDWLMPRMGGLDVCLALRADPRYQNLPVLMLTARAQEADVRRGLAAGADDYILKPFSPREVATRVSAALARSGSGAADG